MFHNQFVKFLTIIMCCNFSVVVCCRAINVDQFIDELPQSKKNELEVFFRYLITVSDFGYTLFGAKPVSMGAWSIEPSLSFLFYPVVNNEIILKKGWSVWMKYSHLFQGNTFCLRATSHRRSTAIYLINRVATSLTIENHLDVFKKYLGRHITTKDILKGLENDQSILDQTLSRNEELLGILLGYGAMNAQKFQKFRQLTEIKSRIPTFPKQLYVTQTDDPWERTIQRLEWRNSKLHCSYPSPVEIEPEIAANQLKSINGSSGRAKTMTHCHRFLYRLLDA